MSAIIHQSSFYKPSRGGHAPGDVREAFCDALDAYDAWEAGAPEPTVELRDRNVPIGAVLGLCWNCTDTMPGWRFDQVGDLLCRMRRKDDEHPRSRTYAASARALRPLVAAAVIPRRR